MLLPPCVEDYVPEEQLARLVIETVDQLDLSCIVGSYNADGMGGAAIAPKAILEPLIYAYAHSLPSSRDSETLCRENLIFRFLSCNQRPDHTTFARNRKRHSVAITELSAQAVVSMDQLSLAAAVTPAANDSKQLLHRTQQAQTNVARTAATGVAAEIEKILADAGYHSKANLKELEQTSVEGFIPSTKS